MSEQVFGVDQSKRIAKGDPYCCEIGCDKLPDVEIWALTGNFEDYTHSCFEHIGGLLGTNTGAEWGTYEMKVVPFVDQR